MIQVQPNGTPMMVPLSSSSSSTDHDHDDGRKLLSIASFNLLAPLYIRPIDQRTGQVQPFAAFEWVSEDDSATILSNEYRLPRLLKHMEDCKCDFICVQELQLEREQEGQDDPKPKSTTTKAPFVLPNWIRPLVENSNHGYKIVLPPQGELEKIAGRNRRVLLADNAITNAIFYKSDSWNPLSIKKTVKHMICF